MMTDSELFQVRVALIQAFLRERNCDGILLSRVDNFAMATGGKRNYVNIMGDGGVCSLFIDKEGRAYCVANTIEAPRILDEELAGFDVDTLRFLWFETSPADVVKAHFTGEFVSDDGSLGDNVHDDLAFFRSLLTPLELEKYRRLGRIAAESMAAALDAIGPGTPEADIAARLVAEGEKRRTRVPVALVAADERIARYRHPLPTEAPLVSGALAERAVKNYVMVVGCFQREGLVVSLTRFKSVGDIDPAILNACDRVAAVDALMQEATEPGRTLGDVFAVNQKAYADFGFSPTEWHNHHQGGPTGYGARTAKGAPNEPFPIGDRGYAQKVREILGIDVAFGQAYAWNPSAPGVKSEDTFLLHPDGSKEIVTLTPELPAVDLARVLGRATDVVKSGIAS